MSEGGLASYDDKDMSPEDLQKKAEQYAFHNDGNISSDEEDIVDIENDEEEKEEEVQMQYATLGADGSDDDFEDFQSAQEEDQSQGAYHLQPTTSTNTNTNENENENENHVVNDMPVEEDLPPLPPVNPADRLEPLSSDKINMIKNAMSGVRIPHRNGGGSEALVQKLLGARLGDEKTAAATTLVIEAEANGK